MRWSMADVRWSMADVDFIDLALIWRWPGVDFNDLACISGMAWISMIRRRIHPFFADQASDPLIGLSGMANIS